MGLLNTIYNSGKPVNPAERIHRIYKENTEDKSSLPHWTRLVKAKGVEDCELLLRHFLSSEILNPPRISMVTLANVDSYLAEARNNPEATQFPVTRKAAELAERINSTEPEAIPAEYVGLSLYRYETLCRAALPWSTDLWYRLPTGSTMIHTWFTEIASYGRLRDRLFSYRAPGFRRWWSRELNSVGFYDGEKIIDSANQLLEKHPYPEMIGSNDQTAKSG